MLDKLSTLTTVHIKQKKELAELFGFETRNRYAIEADGNEPIGYAAENQRGFFGFLFRQFLGHWRSFQFQIFDPNRNHLLTAKHPFRFFFQRLDVSMPDGRLIGAIKRRFSILTKSFDLEDPSGKVLFEVRSPLLKFWTFSFKRNGQEVAVIKKKWSGALKEVLTDADNFEVSFTPEINLDERVLIVVAGIYVDLMFFEAKAGR